VVTNSTLLLMLEGLPPGEPLDLLGLHPNAEIVFKRQ
jgi:hypothetical protein